jgi:hypothetical protein
MEPSNHGDCDLVAGRDSLGGAPADAPALLDPAVLQLRHVEFAPHPELAASYARVAELEQAS